MCKYIDCNPIRPGPVNRFSTRIHPRQEPVDSRVIIDSIRTPALITTQPPGSTSIDSPSPKHLLKHVSVAVQPEDSLARVPVKLVDEEAGPTNKMLAAPFTRSNV